MNTINPCNSVSVKDGGAKMEQDLLSGLANVLDKKIADDISILDISDISPMADYFVIATGNNENHLDALREACDEFMHKNNCKTKCIEGIHHSEWVLIDYGNIIVHLFSRDKRKYYELDRIWRDAKKIN
jgi:ribosome-associated protein